MDELSTDPISAVRDRSPLLRALAARYRDEQPFASQQIGVSAPLTPHTGLFIDTLAAGGATVFATGEAGSTHENVVEWLRSREGIEPLSDTDTDLGRARRELLSREPTLIADDGAHLLTLLHESFSDSLGVVEGACEQTTGGTTRLQEMQAQGELAVPVYNVNDTPMKQHFDNVHGTAESSLSAVTSLTNAMIAGSVVVVAGYGRCGRGLARKLRSLGARTVVTEVDPRNALEALADGHEVTAIQDAVADADFVFTATGRYRVLREEHLDAIADGAIIASIGSNIEIDRKALQERATGVKRPEPGIEQYRFPDSRTVSLLTEGRVVNLAAPNSKGNPSEVMDTTFAMMARGLEAFAEGVSLEPGLHPVPDRLDREVAHEKLEAMDVTIDEVPEIQREYHENWASHDAE